MIMKWFKLSNRQWSKPNPWRDWQRLLAGFLVGLVVVVCLYIYLVWQANYLINNIAGQQAATPTVNQKTLSAILDMIIRRDIDHQNILNSPSSYPDPSK